MTRTIWEVYGDVVGRLAFLALVVRGEPRLGMAGSFVSSAHPDGGEGFGAMDATKPY